MRTFVAILAASAFATQVPAQPPVPPQVSSVVSGGYWSAQGRDGIYRVVVVNEGFEHVTSRVFVEWVAGPKSPAEGSAVVAVVEPSLPFGNEVASLKVALKPLAPGRVRVVVSGMISVEPTQKVRAVVIATAPGVATVSDRADR